MANTFYGGVGASEPRAISDLGTERPTNMPDVGGTMDLFDPQTDPMDNIDPMESGEFQQASPPGGPNDPSAFDAIFEEAAAKYGMDTDILRSMAWQESRFNPTAESPAGAQGMMQFMPQTAQQFGIDPNDPQQAIPAAAKYMTQLETQFGGTPEALAAYNYGPGNFQQAEQQGTMLPQETQDYVSGVFQNAGQAPFPQQVQSPASRFSDMGNMPPPGAQMGQQGMPPQPQGEMGGMPMQPDPMQQAQGMMQGGMPQQGMEQPMPPQGMQQPPPQPQQGGMMDMSGQQIMQQGMQPPQGGGMQQAQQAYQAPEGTLNMPHPEKDPGFWETIRQAAASDPAHFYQILGQLAIANTQGINELIQQKREMGLEREKLQAHEGRREEDRSDRQQRHEESIAVRRESIAASSGAREDTRIGRIRASGSEYLSEFEGEHGTVDTMPEARQFEAHVGTKVSEGKVQKKMDTAIKNVAKNPNIKLRGELQTLYNEDETFRQNYDGVAREGKEAKRRKQEGDRLDNRIKKERETYLKKINTRKDIPADVKQDMMVITGKVNRLMPSLRQEKEFVERGALLAEYLQEPVLIAQYQTHIEKAKQLQQEVDDLEAKLDAYMEVYHIERGDEGGPSAAEGLGDIGDEGGDDEQSLDSLIEKILKKRGVK